MLAMIRTVFVKGQYQIKISLKLENGEFYVSVSRRLVRTYKNESDFDSSQKWSIFETI